MPAIERASAPVGEGAAAADIAVRAASDSSLLDHLNECVFRADERGRFTYLNSAWWRLTGHSESECLGQFCGRFVCPDDRQTFRHQFVALLRGTLPSFRSEVRLLHATGVRPWVQLSVRPHFDCARGVRELAGMAVDIGAIKRAQDQLIRARRDAEAANRAKGDFLSTISHELRTPLNAVIGLSEALLQPGAMADEARARCYLEMVQESGRRLLGMINDMLELVRLDDGRVVFSPGSVDLGSLGAMAVEAARRGAEAKDLRLDLGRPAAPVLIEGDERRLRQALQHVIGNAIKFTPAGGSVSVRVQPGPHGGAEVIVRDTGIGIAPEKQHLLFARFSQVESTRARSFGGSGLGLALTDRIVRLHGGTIAVASRPGQGSTFTLSLPVRARPGHIRGPAEP